MTPRGGLAFIGCVFAAVAVAFAVNGVVKHPVDGSVIVAIAAFAFSIVAESLLARRRAGRVEDRNPFGIARALLAVLATSAMAQLLATSTLALTLWCALVVACGALGGFFFFRPASSAELAVEDTPNLRGVAAMIATVVASFAAAAVMRDWLAGVGLLTVIVLAALAWAIVHRIRTGRVTPPATEVQI